MGERLLAFIQRYLGARGAGTTDINRGQCVGLVELWLTAEGAGPVWGNAKDLLLNAPMAQYTATINTAYNYPPLGAVVCWDGTWGAGFGHTAVVVAATPSLLVVFEQNNPLGHTPEIATHDYTGVAGWLTVKPRGTK